MHPIDHSPVSRMDIYKTRDTRDIDEIFKLRFLTYCLELKTERADDFPDGRERDQWNVHAIHFAAKDTVTDQIVGCLRLVRHSEKEFPMETIFQLPPSNHIYCAGKAVFYVYQTKGLYNPEWTSPKLKELVCECRKSYLRYGDVPQLDEYDPKSAIYLVRAVYPVDSVSRESVSAFGEEWFSMRFVPGDGNPRLNEDMFYCQAFGIPVFRWVQDRLFNSADDFGGHVASMSRLCSIPPRRMHGAARSTSLLPQFPSKMRYTFAMFVLTNLAFFEDMRKVKRIIRHISGMFREELITKVLSIPITERENIPHFVSANAALGFDGRKNVTIDRSYPVYRYPGYFLRIEQVASVLYDLLRKGSISEDCLRHYFKDSCPQGEVPAEATRFKPHSHELAEFLTTDGPLHACGLTGEELRRIMNERVQDGPELKIMNMTEWEEDIQECKASLELVKSCMGNSFSAYS